jgi:hypothetical protein
LLLLFALWLPLASLEAGRLGTGEIADNAP